MIEAILAFAVAAAVLTVTPGLDTALVLRTSAASGPRAASFAVVGIALGCLVWGGIVALGLGALLAASELAFTIVKYVGAAYLLWLGAFLSPSCPGWSVTFHSQDSPFVTRNGRAHLCGAGMGLRKVSARPAGSPGWR